MDFDLFTFIAQLVNFAILIFLLNKYLFKRVQAAMEAREKAISDNLALAEAKRKEAEELASKTAAVHSEVLSRREEMLSIAMSSAEETKNRLLKEAWEEAEEARNRWRDDLSGLKEKFLVGLRQRSGAFVCGLAEKALKDLSDEELNKRIAEVFIVRLNNYPASQARKLKELIGRSNQKLMIKSAFEIPDGLKNNISAAVRRKFEYDRDVLFEKSPDGICGITLAAGGYKISWSIEDYLAGLEEELTAVFDSGMIEAENKEEEKI